MGADRGVIERFCRYDNPQELARYLSMFKRDGLTIVENLKITMQNILDEKFDCAVYEPKLYGITEINKKECTFVPEFLVDIECYFDGSENIETNQICNDLKNMLRKGLKSDWAVD